VVTDDKLRLAAQALGITDPEAVARAVEVLGMVTEDDEGHVTAAPAASELDAALAEHEDESGERLAMIGDVPIRVRSLTPGGMMRYTVGVTSGNNERAAVATGQLVDRLVHPDDQEACWAAIDAAGWEMVEIKAWIDENVEVATGRPPTSPSHSRAQRRHPGAPSNGASTLSSR